MFYWSVLRELWEYRSIYIAPLIVAGVVLFASLLSMLAGIWEKALRKLMQRKAKGQVIEAPEPEEKPSNVINLMDALGQSVRADKPGHPSARKRKGRRRKAA